MFVCIVFMLNYLITVIAINENGIFIPPQVELNKFIRYDSSKTAETPDEVLNEEDFPKFRLIDQPNRVIVHTPNNFYEPSADGQSKKPLLELANKKLEEYKRLQGQFPAGCIEYKDYAQVVKKTDTITIPFDKIVASVRKLPKTPLYHVTSYNSQLESQNTWIFGRDGWKEIGNTPFKKLSAKELRAIHSIGSIDSFKQVMCVGSIGCSTLVEVEKDKSFNIKP